ncbi:hypothetical protein F53441_13244 [Fusarium austroafricanum]|uniref:Uncharacterized protein n=1 Tax=Fusarium austroafricanum TaxID=2364996 RepID=A0A8H4NG41_9HYPO|nr:hypothetical protein F53441_13244 [Fusarium austroafricanum]
MSFITNTPIAQEVEPEHPAKRARTGQNTDVVKIFAPLQTDTKKIEDFIASMKPRSSDWRRLENYLKAVENLTLKRAKFHFSGIKQFIADADIFPTATNAQVGSKSLDQLIRVVLWATSLYTKPLVARVDYGAFWSDYEKRFLEIIQEDLNLQSQVRIVTASNLISGRRDVVFKIQQLLKGEEFIEKSK